MNGRTKRFRTVGTPVSLLHRSPCLCKPYSMNPDVEVDPLEELVAVNGGHDDLGLPHS
jgi:hypothetical protein